MNDNDLYSVDFTRALPPVLKNDPNMLAVATVIAEQLQTTAQQIRKNIIYARIDELEEPILDILAYDLHVDWYDYSYPLEVKRQTIKDSVKIPGSWERNTLSKPRWGLCTPERRSRNGSSTAENRICSRSS